LELPAQQRTAERGQGPERGPQHYIIGLKALPHSL